MLTLQATTNIKNRIESTFQPLYCIVRLYDRGEKLRFNVLDLDYDTAFESPELQVRDLTTERRLLEAIKAQSGVLVAVVDLAVCQWIRPIWPPICCSAVGAVVSAMTAWRKLLIWRIAIRPGEFALP